MFSTCKFSKIFYSIVFLTKKLQFSSISMNFNKCKNVVTRQLHSTGQPRDKMTLSTNNYDQRLLVMGRRLRSLRSPER